MWRKVWLVAFVLMWLGGAGTAAALPTQQFQTTYGAYNPWTSWEWWLAQPQCTETQVVYGSEPSTPGTYPVLIYLHATLSNLSGNQEGQVITQLAAAQGFVALAPTYDSNGTRNAKGFDGNATCMFSSARSSNVISYACSLPEADCSGGVALAGFSQGGEVALLGKNYNSEVTAAWAMGVNGIAAPSLTVPPPSGARTLPEDKVRVDVGQLDVTSGGAGPLNVSGLAAMTGVTCGATYDCLQPDGSGYYVVSNAEVADGTADHCYWMRSNKYFYSCTLYPTIAGLDPGFAPPSTTPWSLISNLNWLRSQL